MSHSIRGGQRTPPSPTSMSVSWIELGFLSICGVHLSPLSHLAGPCALCPTPYSCGIQITLINVLLQDSLSPSEVTSFLLAQTAPLFEAHNIAVLSHRG